MRPRINDYGPRLWPTGSKRPSTLRPSGVVADAVLDSLGMFDLTAGLPEQVEEAAQRARGFGGFRDPASVEQVVIIGMGGSGMAGDVVAAVAAPMLAVPVLVVKSYECPAFVDSGSLVFAVSASGNTEETLQAATDAASAGATMVVVSGGGKLAESAGW